MNWDSRADWFDVGDTVWIDDDDDDGSKDDTEEEKEERSNVGDDVDVDVRGNDGTEDGSADGCMDGDDVDDVDGNNDGTDDGSADGCMDGDDVDDKEGCRDIDNGSMEGIMDATAEWAGISWQTEWTWVELEIDGNVTPLLFKDTCNKWVKRPVFIIFANSVLVPILLRTEFERSR